MTGLLPYCWILKILHNGLQRHTRSDILILSGELFVKLRFANSYMDATIAVSANALACLLHIPLI